jgi:hypothetical protein
MESTIIGTGYKGRRPTTCELGGAQFTKPLMQVAFVRVFQLRRRQRVQFEVFPDGASERLPSRVPLPTQLLNDWVLDGDVASILDALNTCSRAARYSVIAKGLTLRDIARALGIKIDICAASVRCRSLRSSQVAVEHPGCCDRRDHAHEALTCSLAPLSQSRDLWRLTRLALSSGRDVPPSRRFVL